jgi:hypothetical protein
MDGRKETIQLSQRGLTVLTGETLLSRGAPQTFKTLELQGNLLEGAQNWCLVSQTDLPDEIMLLTELTVLWLFNNKLDNN